MYIHKKQHIIISVIALVVMICTSCAYQFDPEVKAITTKTTYEPFENLNRPIVFTMPMVVKALRGYKRLGDVFIIYDWEKGKVADHVFFPGNNGLVHPRCTEVTLDDTICYLAAAGGSHRIACLNPKKTELDIYEHQTDREHGLYILMEQTSFVENPPKYALLTDYREPFAWHFFIFNAETGTFGKVHDIPTSSSAYVSDPVAGNDGTYWYSSSIESRTEIRKGINELFKIDCESDTVEKQQNYAIEKYEGENSFITHVRYVDDSKVLIFKGQLGLEHSFAEKIFVFDKETQTYEEIEKNREEYYIYNIVKVENKYYCICMTEVREDKDNFIVELDLENKKMGPTLVAFDMTYTYSPFVRGSRIYFMDSWNSNDIKIRYYDCSTGELSGFYGVKFGS